MIKKVCPNCGKPSYSASEFGLWICPHCETSLRYIPAEPAEKNDDIREQIIQRYEQIIDEWDKNPHLKTILPDTYKNICYKLQMLKADVDYKVVDVTKDCVMAGGILMCGAQIMTNNSVYAYTNKYQRRLKKL